MSDDKVVTALVAFEEEKGRWRITGREPSYATRRIPEFTDAASIEDRYDDGFLIHNSLVAAETHINLRAMEAALKAVGLMGEAQGKS